MSFSSAFSLRVGPCGCAATRASSALRSGSVSGSNYSLPVNYEPDVAGEGTNLLSKDLFWKIGDGENVRLWKDR